MAVSLALAGLAAVTCFVALGAIAVSAVTAIAVAAFAVSTWRR